MYNAAINSLIEKKLNSFFARFPKKTYKKGGLLIRAGENPPGIFFIKDGMVREYSISREGEEVVFNVFKKGSFFPMSWALTGENNRYFYEAFASTQVHKAPKEEVIRFVQEETDVLFDLLCRVYKGTNGLLQRLEYLMTENAYRQMVVELILHAKRFGKKGVKDSVSINVDEKELASHTGMTRETISRELRVLKDKGLVTFKNRTLVINDFKKLEDELID